MCRYNPGEKTGVTLQWRNLALVVGDLTDHINGNLISLATDVGVFDHQQGVQQLLHRVSLHANHCTFVRIIN